MGNIFYQDFRDFISSLNNNDVEYILVGGYSVIYHGYSRTTGDLDIWVNRTKENYTKLKKSFSQFGMSLFDMTEDNFLNHNEWNVFSFGNPPVSIDILINVKGLIFDECFSETKIFDDDGLKIKSISYKHLIEAKKASNRAKDIDDIQNLENR